MNRENKILMQAIEHIESLTRNPREYEPSVYTINHIAREALKEIREINKIKDERYFEIRKELRKAADLE